MMWDHNFLDKMTPRAREALAATADLYEKVGSVIPMAEWVGYAQDIVAINRLKQEREAIILAHNYMTPEIFYGVADIVGDSLLLAREAAKTTARTIVVAGVHFMAETAKLLNPDRVVLSPDIKAGCSLADSITPDDVKKLRHNNPNCPVVTYVNTSAAVKAESDICCTSGNARRIVESLCAPRVIMIPDQYLAQNVARETSVEIVTSSGACDIHKCYTADSVYAYRAMYPQAKIAAHPECQSEVVMACDFSGSTADMAVWIDREKPRQVVMITEVSMSDNLAVLYKDTQFIRPCASCPYMKMITLKKIRASLENLTTEVFIDPRIEEKACNAVQRMMDVL